MTLQSSSLPRAYGYAFHVTSKERNVDHAELVGDPDIQQDIVEFLAARQIGSTGEKARPWEQSRSEPAQGWAGEITPGAGG